MDRIGLEACSLSAWLHEGLTAAGLPAVCLETRHAKAAMGAMPNKTDIDVSLESSSLCVVDATGRIVREAKVASEPEVLAGFCRGLGLTIVRIGLEAGPLSQWLHAGLAGRANA